MPRLCSGLLWSLGVSRRRRSMPRLPQSLSDSVQGWDSKRGRRPNARRISRQTLVCGLVSGWQHRMTFGQWHNCLDDCYWSRWSVERHAERAMLIAGSPKIFRVEVCCLCHAGKGQHGYKGTDQPAGVPNWDNLSREIHWLSCDSTPVRKRSQTILN